MKNIFSVARYTYLEMVRNKILYILLFFSFFIIGLGIIITQMTMGNPQDIISDIGLGTTEIFLTVTSVFIGVSLVRRELTLKTLHPLFARPVSRAEYMLGKFFGIEITLFVLTLVMSVIFMVLLSFYGGFSRFFTFIPAIYTIFIQTSMVTAVAVFCSTLAEPAVAAMLSVSFYIIGTISYNLVHFITKNTSESVVKLVTTVRYILPDFHYFNIKNNLVYGTGIDKISLTSATFYSLAWIVILLALAVVFFNKKEIN